MPPFLQRLLPPADRYRREWWWLTLVLIASGIVLVVWLWQELHSLQHRENQRLEQQAQMLHDSLALQMRSIDKALGSLLATQTAQTGSSTGSGGSDARLQQHLEALGSALLGVQALTVLDKQGVIVRSSRPDLLGVQCKSWPYFSENAAQVPPHTLLISPPFASSHHAGQQIMVIARQLPSIDGHFSGLVTAQLRDSDFHALLRSALHTRDSRIGLLHGQGMRFVALSAEEAPLNTQTALNAPDLLLAQFLASGQTRQVMRGRVHPNDEPRLAVMQLLQVSELPTDVPLVIAVSRDWAQVLQPWRKQLLWTVLLYLLLAVAAGLGLRAMQANLRHLQRQEERLHAKNRALDARWQAVLTATSQGVWDYDLQRQKVYFSPVWKSMLGYEEQDIGSSMKEWASRIHPDDWPQAQALWVQVTQGLVEDYSSVHRMRCKDGSWRWMLNRGRIIARDSSSNLPLRVVGTQSDISEEHYQRQRFEHLAHNVPGMTYQLQEMPEGNLFFPYCSEGIAEIYGISADVLAKGVQPLHAIVHPDDLPQLISSTYQSGKTLALWECAYRVNHPRRGLRWVKGRARPQRLEDGSTLWHGYVYDITETKQQAIQLEAAQEMQQHLMETMPVALCLVDAQRQIYYRNQQFLEYFGYTAEEVPSMDAWAQHAYPEQEYRQKVSRQWREALEQAKAKASGQGHLQEQEYRVTARSGTLLTVVIRGMYFEDKLLVTFHDRTAQQAQAEQWQRQASMDGLTGLANRREFDRCLQAEWQRCRRSGQPLSLIMLDIDFFKQYNDRYGHPQGDACLQAVAKVLAPHAVRSYDLVARYGGEEFACLLPECTWAGAIAKAQAICQAVYDLQWEHKGSGVAKTVTVSLGVAQLLPDGNKTPADLLALADARLYAAKQAGRNGVHDGEHYLPGPSSPSQSDSPTAAIADEAK